jgi:predicted MPP superfamily phosphohydrolase
LDETTNHDEGADVYEKLNNPTEWKWIDDKSTLVFMGDYVDKGPTSKHTVEFVKNLTTAFPTKVTAILGNHELELLRE